MTPAAIRLLRRALSLRKADRAALAAALIESLDGTADPDADAAWADEIRRRVAALDAGAPTVSWPEARAAILRD
jgi:putative addiction module component (TIGR02574 family)